MALTSAGVSTVPVESEKMVSPSLMVCTGLIARAKPSCAICAILVICGLVKRALVATQPMVVFAPRCIKTRSPFIIAAMESR